MQIIKRNGTTESYDREKIAVAIRKSFISTQKEITDEAVYTIVDEVEQFLHQNEANRSVERIQDEVERSLMEHGFPVEGISLSISIFNFFIFNISSPSSIRHIIRKQPFFSHSISNNRCCENMPNPCESIRINFGWL